MSALATIPVRNAQLAEVDAEDIDRVLRYVETADRPSTRRANATHCRQWAEWCADRDVDPVPASPVVVASYLTELDERGLSVSTITHRLSAIRRAHRAYGSPLPDAEVLKLTMRSIRNRHLDEPPRKVRPLLTEHVQAIVDRLGVRAIDDRNRALLLVGFAGALRRSELCKLEVRDLDWSDPRGVFLLLRGSKTDTTGEGQCVFLCVGSNESTCAVTALRTWLATSGIEDGPIFRGVDRWGNVADSSLSGEGVARIVKKAIRGIGLDPSEYSGHSLRAGFATQAALNGADSRNIQRQTRHKSATVLQGYIRIADMIRDNASGCLGL